MKQVLTIVCLLIGTQFVIAQNNKNLTVDFSEIDSLEYMEFKMKYPNEVLFDSTKKTIVDSSFVLLINGKEQTFINEYDNRYYYRGFLPSLQSYVLTHCGMLWCLTSLIDQTSGKQLDLESTFDNEAEIPLISKNGNMMLVFASNVFSPASYISLYQKVDKEDNLGFSMALDLSVDLWDIQEAIWVSDNSFALKIADYNDDERENKSRKVRYMIGKIE